jgi:hypothetical protein
MKSYIILFLFLVSFVASPALANRIPEKWEPGVIHLEGQSLQGEVSYDPKLDVVFCKSDGRIQTFTAHTVRHFEIYDEGAGITRSFSSLSDDATASRERKTFFEVMVDGDLTLLRKGKYAKIARPKGKYHRVTNRILEAKQKPEIVYRYYLLRKDGLQEIRHFRRQVLPLMHDREAEMRQFINSHKFNLENPQSHILIINYYNHLKKNEVLSQGC